MKTIIEYELNEDLLDWLIDSLYTNLDLENIEQTEFIEYLESKQDEN